MNRDLEGRYTEPLEARLSAVLGAPRLSPDAYRDQLARVEAAARPRRRMLPQERNKGAWIAGAVVVMLGAAAVLGAVLGLYSRDGGEIALWQEVAAIERSMEFPPPGAARHLTIDVTRQEDLPGERTLVLDVWLRALDDGSREIAVEASDAHGQQIGRYVENRDGWYLEYQGSVSSGDGNAGWVPAELDPEQATSLELIDTTISEFDDDLIEVIDARGIRTYRIDVSSRMGNDHSDVSSLLWIVKVDLETGRALGASLIGVTTAGSELTISERSLVSWTEQAAASVNQAVFAIPAANETDKSDDDLRFTAPPTGSLPRNLSVTMHHLDAQDAVSGWYSERVAFTNDDGLRLELAVTPSEVERSIEHREDATVRTVASSVGEITWTAVMSQDRPAGATWSDDSFQYTLTIQPGGEWTVDDLVAFVEQIAAVQE